MSDKVAEAVPQTLFCCGNVLLQVKRAIQAGDSSLSAAAKRLRNEAEDALTAGPYSVVYKEAVPPSGDKHDYMSMGPYWWPDPAKPDGKPYIRRDGEVNPESRRYDSQPLGKMCTAVDTLALAGFFFAEEQYYHRAAYLLRTWFLDPSTCMNPHLNYGQHIPGVCEGRGIGIIDTVRLAHLTDALAILSTWSGWPEEEREGIYSWLSTYLEWLTQSKFGKDEAKARNNHGTWYDVQVAALSLATANHPLVRRVIRAVPARRIAPQIEPDGRQPSELERTRALSYSVYNLRAFFDLATLGARQGCDLWNYTTSDGRSIKSALDWLVPYICDERPWPYRQITPFDYDSFFQLLRRANLAYGDERYERLAAKLRARGVDLESSRTNLIYPPWV